MFYTEKGEPEMLQNTEVQKSLKYLTSKNTKDSVLQSNKAV